MLGTLGYAAFNGLVSGWNTLHGAILTDDMMGDLIDILIISLIFGVFAKVMKGQK